MVRPGGSRATRAIPAAAARQPQGEARLVRSHTNEASPAAGTRQAPAGAHPGGSHATELMLPFGLCQGPPRGLPCLRGSHRCCGPPCMRQGLPRQLPCRRGRSYQPCRCPCPVASVSSPYTTVAAGRALARKHMCYPPHLTYNPNLPLPSPPMPHHARVARKRWAVSRP